MRTRFEDYLARQEVRWGDSFDPSDLDKRFIPFYNDNSRVKVRRHWDEGDEYAITGTIGITTGWRPCFLLMRTSRSIGSSDTLGSNQVILAIKPEFGRHYSAYQGRNP